MRKVTGYIGALIVVIALMGSILAGYALNVNGQSVVVNEYENVTDVSGLYSHTDQKTYTDYNPASNYIGYSTHPVRLNETSNSVDRYKLLDNGTITITPTGFNAFNKNYQLPNSDGPILWSSYGYIYWTSSTNQFSNRMVDSWHDITTVTITKTPNELIITDDVDTKTFPTQLPIAIYYPYDDYDTTRISANDTFIYTTSTNVRGFGDVVGMDDDIRSTFIVGNFTRLLPSGTDYNIATPTITKDSDIILDISEGHINTYSSAGVTITPTYLYLPKVITATSTIPGIDYTESNRVNNYPIEYSYQDNTQIQTLPQINLKSISATNYYPNSGNKWIIGSLDMNYNFEYNGINYKRLQINDLYPDSGPGVEWARYSLADLVAIMDIPVGTTQIIFDTGDYVGKEITTNGYSTPYYNTGHYVPSNFAALVSSTTPYAVPMIDIDYGWKAYYDIGTGLVDIYTTTGVKLSTSELMNTYVQFSKYPSMRGNAGKIYGTTTNDVVRDLGTGEVWWATLNDNPNNPYLNATAVSRGVIEDTTYLDTTKGISIKPSNISDVIWNNNYENGNIQLLFRAVNIDNTYHNEFEVSDNTVSVDYDGSRFYVALNGGEPVDIGTWRSIILDIDLENGELYAIPVRTFNSYTNVQMDNASIFVGNMTDYTTSNIIIWNPTPDSFTFSVYNTSVFMNTYGVVMADPSITITDFFTNLDNFYRLELSNFSIYGDSMTINEKVGTVNGNRVTFGDESLIIKKLYIEYADGNVYLSDGSTVIDLGELASNHIFFGGAWYFKTFLQKGYTVNKQVYTWDWQTFILDNTEFCVIYIGLALAAFIVARRFCTFTVMDYVVLGISLIIAFGVQVIA